MAEINVLIPTGPPLTYYVHVTWMDRRGRAGAEAHIAVAVSVRARACSVTRLNPPELFPRLSQPRSCTYARSRGCLHRLRLVERATACSEAVRENGVVNLGISLRSTGHLLHGLLTRDLEGFQRICEIWPAGPDFSNGKVGQ